MGGSRSFGFSRSAGRSGSGSDSLSWRKEGTRGSGRRVLSEEEKGDEEDTSPSKSKTNEKGGTLRQLLLGDDSRGLEKAEEEASGVKGGAIGMELEKQKVMQARADKVKEKQQDGHNKQSRKFKRVRREDRDAGVAKAGNIELGGKRGRGEDTEEKEGKKGKVDMEVEEKQECVEVLRSRSWLTKIAHRPGCKSSPVGHNENNKLELPGPREWPDSSKPPRYGEEGGARHFVPSRN